MFEIGSSLREARVRRKLELSQVEADTRIRAKYLMALESKALPVAAVARRTVTHPTRPRPRTATTSRASAPAGAATNPGPSATATRHHQAARAHAAAASALPAGPDSTLDRLVSVAGILTALTLAPVGAG